MLKTIIFALIYFLFGMGICQLCVHEKKNDPGFIAFVLLFWPVIAAIYLVLFILSLMIYGLKRLIGADKNE